jgi:drug/metabolite transporter (DMT)-like permease
VFAGALLQAAVWQVLQQVHGAGHCSVADGGQLGPGPVPAEASVVGWPEASGVEGGRGELGEAGQLFLWCGPGAGAGKEQRVEQLACLDGSLQLGLGIFAYGRRVRDEPAALAPQEQVGRGAESLACVDAAAALGCVDEVKGDMPADERQLGDILHALMVPAKGVLLVNCSSESSFAGTRTSGAPAMMAIMLAVIAAAGWGASDYFGGDASGRDIPVFAVVAMSELLGLIALAPALAARGIPPPASPRLVLAAVAGVAVTAELSLIYSALNRGDAFFTAPVGAMGAAMAATVGVIGGDPLSPVIVAGLACAVGGGGITAWTSPSVGSGGTALRAAATCLGAAASVTVMLACLHAAGGIDPYWVTATEHASTALSAGLAAARKRHTARHALPRRQWAALAVIAVTGTGGDLAYTAASHHGTLSIVSAISSLYPVATIALGRLLQGRRGTRTQRAGITLALVGAVLLGFAAR